MGKGGYAMWHLRRVLLGLGALCLTGALTAGVLWSALCLPAAGAVFGTAALVLAPGGLGACGQFWGQTTAVTTAAPAAVPDADPSDTAPVEQTPEPTRPAAVTAATPEAAEPSGEVLQNDADPAPLSTAPPTLENGGEILARRYSQGSGAGYVTLAAGSIKNSTQHTDAELAAAADGPLPFDIELDSADPQVLILHTHATETYQPWDELVFDPDFSARTTDTAANMVAVGARMARVLNEAGINTVQDTTLHDSPSYTESYARSAQTARSWVAKYPSIKVILDVHRDAIESDGARIKPLCQIDGQDTAQVMIIAGCDNGATVCLPNWQENLKFAAAWESAMESAYPGLTRPVLCGYRFYNQDVTTGSLLIEVGGHANTLAEALRGGEYAARALAALFGGQS